MKVKGEQKMFIHNKRRTHRSSIETLAQLIMGFAAVSILATFVYITYCVATGDYTTIETMQRLNGHYIIIDHRSNFGQDR